ncbi:MAG: NAD-dependent 4,6-dehydratase LegB [Candidatus Zapsychrus exili]|nr:NAD-dependent 4,6-dehydratase LegB [Candidatus Zapsychrus exili]
MDLKNKKVLVTGSDGFIGSHLAERLIKKGARVKAFVYYNSFNSWGWLDTLPKNTLAKIEVFTGDIRDPNGVLTAMKGTDVVFHLAALIGIPFSYHSPDSYVDTNIKGTLNILQAVRQLKVKKILHTSTSEIYGTAQYVPIDEDHPINPQSPYAATKSSADQIAMSFYRSFKTPVTIVRPFNTFGPRQSARAIIPTIISQIYAGSKTIKLGNLDATRDFTYVTDTADAFIEIAQQNGTNGKIFNVGNNKEISVRDLVSTISNITKKKIKIIQDKNRMRPDKSEVQRLVCDNLKIRKAIDWKPRVSLEAGLKKTCGWIKNNINHYKPEIYNV